MNNNTRLLNNWRNEIESFSYLSSTFSIALFSLNGEMLYANPSFKALIGKTPCKSFINPSFEELVAKLNLENEFNGFITLGSIVDNKSIKTRIVKNESEILILGEYEIQELFSLNLKMIELNREINNLQRQIIKEKQTLSRTNAELKKLNEEKNKFLGIAAHDLRNPIGTALGYSDLLSKRFEKLDKQSIGKFLSVITDSCKFSLNLLNELLDISKIESGKINLNQEICNYSEFIEQIIEKNKLVAIQKEIRIVLDNHLGNFEIKIDQQKIEQVLNNIISNAIKYSNTNTTITIKISQKNNSILTEIIDQGLGIESKELDKLFAPFQTTSTKSTSGEKSTGLGLAIVKKIINEHSGDINVQSTLGKGSNFNFTLPKEI